VCVFSGQLAGDRQGSQDAGLDMSHSHSQEHRTLHFQHSMCV